MLEKVKGLLFKNETKSNISATSNRSNKFNSIIDSVFDRIENFEYRDEIAKADNILSNEKLSEQDINTLDSIMLKLTELYDNGIDPVFMVEIDRVRFNYGAKLVSILEEEYNKRNDCKSKKRFDKDMVKLLEKYGLKFNNKIARLEDGVMDKYVNIKDRYEVLPLGNIPDIFKD